MKKNRNPGVILIGAFPPPVHGLSIINSAFLNAINKKISRILIINLRAASLERSIKYHFKKLISFAPNLLKFLINISSGRYSSLYIGLSGGLGQIYDSIFIGLGKLFNLRIFIHHHSFAYINHANSLNRFIFWLAGSEANHILLCEAMASNLQNQYPNISNCRVLSNSAFMQESVVAHSLKNKNLDTVGFFGNISFEKGIVEFIEVVKQLNQSGFEIHGKIGGNIQDTPTKSFLFEEISKNPFITYEGPKIDGEKKGFYEAIDVLLMPTKYENEAEPLVIHEAMAAGTPVIGWGRGCIPAIIPNTAGIVIPVDQDFISNSIKKLIQLIEKPKLINSARDSAVKSFSEIRDVHYKHLDEIIEDLIDTTHLKSEQFNHDAQYSNKIVREGKSLNILHISPAFYPATMYGGPVRVIYEIAKRQVLMGHSVSVITSNVHIESKIATNKWIDMNGIRSLYLPYLNGIKNLFGAHILLTPGFITLASKEISSQNYDIIHIHEMRHFFSPIIAWLCGKYKVPYVITPHGTLGTSGVSMMKKKFFDMLFGKRIIRNSNGISALTDVEKDELQRLFHIDPYYLKVIPNGISVDAFKDVTPNDQFKHSIGLSKSDKMILYVGRLNKSKGLDLLIEAFKFIAGSDVQAHLVLAGVSEGTKINYQKVLERLVNDLDLYNKVKFIGQVSGDQKIQAYKSADVFVLPSRHEPFGLVILEALASGCPTVITAEAALSNDLRSAGAAMISKLNTEDLFNCINNVLSNKRLREQMIRNGLQFVNHFSWDSSTQEFINLYKKALK
jgi:glycosyltransferase involved in cell wall biosynthesis